MLLHVKVGPLNFRLRLSDLLADLTINLYRCISIQITNLLYFLLSSDCRMYPGVTCAGYTNSTGVRDLCAIRSWRLIDLCARSVGVNSSRCDPRNVHLGPCRVLPSTTFRSRRIVSYSRRKLVIDPVCQSYCLLLIDVYDPRLLTEICRQTKVIVLVSWCAWVSMRVVLLLYVDW